MNSKHGQCDFKIYQRRYESKDKYLFYFLNQIYEDNSILESSINQNQNIIRNLHCKQIRPGHPFAHPPSQNPDT